MTRRDPETLFSGPAQATPVYLYSSCSHIAVLWRPPLFQRLTQVGPFVAVIIVLV